MSLDPLALAIAKAWEFQTLTYPNPSVGAAVVECDGSLVSVESHKCAGKPHAEVLALREAYVKLSGNNEILKLDDAQHIHNYLLNHHNNIFKSCTIYSTLEPCSHVGMTPSCASLIGSLGLKRVVVGALDPTSRASGGMQMLSRAGVEVEYLNDRRCEELMLPFVISQQKTFTLFKWAQRLNATVDGGVISSLKSREFVHSIRDRVDLLVIGGESVRVDRPTLDARLVGGKAPDILIYSRQKDFDKTIPLFSVENREVFITDDLSLMGRYRFVLVEGTQKLYDILRDKCDILLCFIAPRFGGRDSFSVTKEYKILHQSSSGDDVMIWMR